MLKLFGKIRSALGGQNDQPVSVTKAGAAPAAALDPKRAAAFEQSRQRHGLVGAAVYNGCAQIAGAPVGEAQALAAKVLAVHDAAIIRTLLNGEPNRAEPAAEAMSRCPMRLAIFLRENAIDAAQMAFLLALGGDPNARDHEKGLTPLLAVAELGDGQVEVARLLVGAGAALDATNAEGANAIGVAVRSSAPTGEMVAYLREAGCDIDHCADDGLTPLMTAIYKLEIDKFAEILAAGADPLAQKTGGGTASEYVRWLLRNERIQAAKPAVAVLGSMAERLAAAERQARE